MSGAVAASSSRVQNPHLFPRTWFVYPTHTPRGGEEGGPQNAEGSGGIRGRLHSCPATPDRQCTTTPTVSTWGLVPWALPEELE